MDKSANIRKINELIIKKTPRIIDYAAVCKLIVQVAKKNL